MCVREDLHQLITTNSEHQKLLMQQAEERKQQDKVIAEQRARIDELTNKLLKNNSGIIPDSDKSDGVADESDDENTRKKTKTRKRKSGFQNQHSRLLSETPICNHGRCKRQVLERIKSTGAYKKKCSTCLAGSTASKQRNKKKSNGSTP